MTQESIKNQLLNKIELEKAISQISTNFLGTQNLQESVDFALAKIASISGACRTYIFETDLNTQKMTNTYEWCADGIEPQIENLKDLPFSIFPWWMDHVLNNKVIAIPDVGKLPSEAEAEKEILEAQDIKSLIVIPIKFGESIKGFIGFDNVYNARDWSDEDLYLLKMTGEVVANAFHNEEIKQELTESEKKYRMIFEGNRDGLVFIDMEGKIIDANKSYCQMLGYSLEELKALNSILDLSPENWHQWEHEEVFKKELFKKGYSGVYQKEYIKKDGTTVPIEVQAYANFDSDGVPIERWAVTRDISIKVFEKSEKENIQKQLIQSAKLASIGELAAGIGHEINNPLTVISSYAKKVEKNYRNGELSDDLINKALSSQQKACERIKHITDGLRTYVRIDDPNNFNFDLNLAVKNTLDFLGVVYEKEGISIDKKLSIKELIISGNAGRFQQILTNLLSNAKDATLDNQQRNVSIETYTQNNYASLKVTDNGVGIKRELQSKIFDSFYTTKEIGSGTGLGLSIVKNLVAQMNGTISVRSSEGKGTTFEVRIPLST